MKSGSGRYQSRVFSFLSQQTLRWRDRANQAINHAKIAAAWSFQILLYPLYATFQTTRLLNRQIGRSVRHTTARLRSAQQTLQKQTLQKNPPAAELPLLTSDTPLINTLQHLPPLEDHLAQTTIQGIASLLPTQELVLISSENAILDVLTPEQQSQLQRQIIWQVASYWRQQRLLSDRLHESNPQAATFLPAIGDRPQAWLPIRIFYRLMTWMQVSPVALATDVFAESQALQQAAPRFVAQLPASDRSENQQLLRSAELSWSNLEDLFSDLFPPQASSDSQTYPDTDPRLLASLQATFTGLAQRFTQLATHLVERSGIVLTSPSSPAAPPSSPAAPPWLTLSDLFTSAASRSSATDWETFNPAVGSSASIEQVPAKKNRLPAASQPRLVTPLIRSLTQPLASAATRRNSGKNRGCIAAIDEIAIDEIAIDEIAIDEIALYDRASHQAASIQPMAIDPQDVTLAPPPYIDAEVKLVRYEKHPLEQVLQWLDLGMVWIEETLAKTLKWLRDRLGIKDR